jgi:transporter family protein
MWAVYAVAAAFFAALTAIFAKIGLENVNSNLAVAVRTLVVLIIAWGIVFATGRHNDIIHIEQKTWLFLALSGAATGVSWLFFHRALQLGDASKVIPVDKLSIVIAVILAFILLGETLTAKTAIGGLLITAGTIIMVIN